MKKTNVLTSLFLAVAAIFITQMTVSADTIEFSDSYTDILTELSDQQLRVSYFDAALGTLTGVEVTLLASFVEVTLGASLTSSGQITNNAAQAQDFTVATRAQQYDGVGINLPTALSSPVTAITPFTLIAEQSYVGLGVGETADFGPGTTGLVKSSLFSGFDGSFIDTGEFGYDFTTLIVTSFVGGGGNISADIQTFADAVLKVEYTYDAPSTNVVPEPGTMLLLGFGLLGLAGINRKKS